MSGPALDCSGGALQDAVVDLGHHFGWVFFHARPGQSAKGWRTPVAYDGAGFPDLICVNPSRGVTCFREIKMRYEKLRPDQESWGNWLCNAGQDWKVWRPQHWDEIVGTLTFGRGLS